MVIVLWCGANVTQASTLTEYQNAENEYLQAVISLATYSDRIGQFARYALNEQGWDIVEYQDKYQNAHARIILAKKKDLSGAELYILAVPGTENLKDAVIDLTFDKVYFAGHNPAEFVENANKKNVSNDLPKVHKGFNKYTQAMFSEKMLQLNEEYQEHIIHLLKNNPQAKVYLTGHSLGGAVATIGAARLISMDIDPKQIEVLTFGAPAVGNQAFADEIGTKINLKRVVLAGDGIVDSFKVMVGGYVQFGKEEKWKLASSVAKHPHRILAYVDAAIRNYYDKKAEAENNNELYSPVEKNSKGKEKVSIAKLNIKAPLELTDDFYYMEQVMADVYRNHLGSYEFIAEAGQGVTENLDSAKRQQSEFLFIPELEIYNDKTAKGKVYKVQLTLYVYNVVKGTLERAFVYCNDTDSFTPIEAVMYNNINMLNDLKDLKDLK